MSVEQDGSSPTAPHPADKLVAGRPAAEAPGDRLVAGARPGPGSPRRDTAPLFPSGALEEQAANPALGGAPDGPPVARPMAPLPEGPAPEGGYFAGGPALQEANPPIGGPVEEGDPTSQGGYFAGYPQDMNAPVSGAAEPGPQGGAFGQGSVPPGVDGPGGGGVPPAGRGRGGRRRVLVLAGAVVTVVAVAAVAGVVVLGGDESETEPGRPRPAAPPAWSKEAGRQIATGAGLRYDGTLTVGGRPVQARLRVTPAGTASGTLTAGASKADIVAVDGVTYLRAGVAFWRDYAGEDAHPENYADRWSKAPASMPGFDIPGVLGSASIARSIAKGAAKAGEETVQGVRARRITTDGADYLISAAAPYRLLGVRGAGRGEPRFTAVPLADSAALFTELRSRVAALGGAADPGLHFTPGRLSFVNCDQNTSGCTVSVPATLSSPDGQVPDGARAALLATITSAGRPLGTCTGAGPVPSNRRLVLRCLVTGRAWRVWMHSALDKPGRHPYEARARVVGEAVAASRVPGLLAAVDRERGAKAGAQAKRPPAGNVPKTPAKARTTAPAVGPDEE
ncbi:hypothetical protein [Actinomadura roseirufa]|uniref:hypothetical protein n=1 Tax=Actinomadura roseirufa TaxID=2094049 RepID=UPI001041305F|nr:hypothetical protein [Actinomadura roseirufa]